MVKLLSSGSRIVIHIALDVWVMICGGAGIVSRSAGKAGGGIRAGRCQAILLTYRPPHVSRPLRSLYMSF
jgi:hypothetical protein